MADLKDKITTGIDKAADKTKEAATKTGRAADKAEDKVADKYDGKAIAKSQDGPLAHAENHTGPWRQSGSGAEWLNGGGKRAEV